MKLPLPLCSGLLCLALLAPCARSQVVVDDFSTNQFGTNYVQKNVPGFTGGAWDLVGGQLYAETTAGGGYGAFVWTAHALQNVGDWASIDLRVVQWPGEHNAGLSVWSSTASSFDRLLEPRLSYNSSYSFIGSDESQLLWTDDVTAGAASGFVTLKLTLSERSGGDTTLAIQLSNGDGQIGAIQTYTIPGFNDALYVGPSAWQATNGNVAFDNLTYSVSAVPEPSTYAAVFGTAALGFAAWRRRSRAAKTPVNAS